MFIFSFFHGSSFFITFRENPTKTLEIASRFRLIMVLEKMLALCTKGLRDLMNEFNRSFVSFSVVLFLLIIIFSEPLSWPSDGKQTYPAAFLLANGKDKPGCKSASRPTPTMSKHTWRTWDEGNLY